MKRWITLCDLCAADGELTVVTHTYTNDRNSGPFDACDEHAEEVRGYDFPTRELPHPGNLPPAEF